jgi:hypothetical protein
MGIKFMDREEAIKEGILKVTDELDYGVDGLFYTGDKKEFIEKEKKRIAEEEAEKKKKDAEKEKK